MPDFHAKNITMDDIAKCKGSANFTVRFIGQVQMAWKTGGKFVTDKAVAEFMSEHFRNVDDVDKQFKKLIAPATPTNTFEAKKLKKEQADGLRMLKVFINASESQVVRFVDVEDKMKNNLAILKGLKEMDKYDPVDLLRASVFEKIGDFRPANDLKSEFNTFIKNADIQTEDDLKASYQDFKNKIANAAQEGDREALAKLKSYAKDHSLRAYTMSEKLNLDARGVQAIREMPLSKLLKANQSEKVVEVSQLSSPEIQRIISEGRSAMAAAYSFLDGANASLKADFNSFLEEFGKENVIDDPAARKNAYVIFQKGVMEAAGRGDAEAIRKLQRYAE